MNTLLNDRAFMAQFEKSKLEAKQRARQDSDLMVEGIYARMFVDLSGWVDTNQQVQQQQQREEEEELQLQALPFIIETDGSTELCAQIAAAAAATNAELNSQVGRPALQNESLLINQQDNAPIPPVAKEEFATSVTVIKNFANIKNDNIGNSNITKNNIIITKKFYGRKNQISNNADNFRNNKKKSNIIISNTNTNGNINNSVTNNKNNETRNVINRNIKNPKQTSTSICIANDNDTEMNCGCAECLLKEEEQSINKVGNSKDFLEEAHLMSTRCHAHKKQAHIFTCEICSKQFTRSSGYDRHLASVHSSGHNCKYSCRFCERKFYYDGIRVKHENSVHHKIRPFRCIWEGCQFGSACRENVVSHVGSIHFGVPQKEQRKMRKNGGLLDFGKYVRKVIPSVATRKQAKK